MKTNFSTANFLNQFKNSRAVQALIPLGFAPNLPIITSVNGTLCLKIPFLKYKVTGVVDKTLVYPIRYVITVSLSNLMIVSYEDLSYNETFSNVNFARSVGTFRHDAVKNLNKQEFADLRNKLFDEYDKMIAFLADGAEYTEADKELFINLFNRVLEPSLKPFYHAIDNNFATRFLSV